MAEQLVGGKAVIVDCVTVKNITLAVPDDVYRAARVAAARKSTSVSALVRGFLEGLAHDEDEFDRLFQLQEQMFAKLDREGGGIDTSKRMTREQLHDRDAFR